MWAGTSGDFPSRERDGTELGPWKPGSWALKGSPLVPLGVPRRDAVGPPDAGTGSVSASPFRPDALPSGPWQPRNRVGGLTGLERAALAPFSSCQTTAPSLVMSGGAPCPGLVGGFSDQGDLAFPLSATHI